MLYKYKSTSHGRKNFLAIPMLSNKGVQKLSYFTLSKINYLQEICLVTIFKILSLKKNVQNKAPEGNGKIKILHRENHNFQC